MKNAHRVVKSTVSFNIFIWLFTGILTVGTKLGSDRVSHSLSSQELDVKIDTTLIPVWYMHLKLQQQLARS